MTENCAFVLYLGISRRNNESYIMEIFIAWINKYYNLTFQIIVIS